MLLKKGVSVFGMVFIMDRTGAIIKVLDLAMGKTEDEYTVELTNQGICFAVNDNDEIYAVAKKGIFLLENGKTAKTILIH